MKCEGFILAIFRMRGRWAEWRNGGRKLEAAAFGSKRVKVGLPRRASRRSSRPVTRAYRSLKPVHFIPMRSAESTLDMLFNWDTKRCRLGAGSVKDSGLGLGADEMVHVGGQRRKFGRHRPLFLPTERLLVVLLELIKFVHHFGTLFVHSLNVPLPLVKVLDVLSARVAAPHLLNFGGHVVEIGLVLAVFDRTLCSRRPFSPSIPAEQSLHFRGTLVQQLRITFHFPPAHHALDIQRRIPLRLPLAFGLPGRRAEEGNVSKRRAGLHLGGRSERKGRGAAPKPRCAMNAPQLLVEPIRRTPRLLSPQLQELKRHCWPGSNSSKLKGATTGAPSLLDRSPCAGGAKPASSCLEEQSARPPGKASITASNGLLSQAKCWFCRSPILTHQPERLVAAKRQGANWPTPLKQSESQLPPWWGRMSRRR